MTDRGVSEVLGFMLVFALVTGTIGMVYTAGFSGLQDTQQAEKLHNVERAFDVLADNIRDVHHRGAPSRATEVKLAGGSLRTGEPVTIQIDSDAMENTSTISLEPIVYEDDGGTSLIYTGGAVLRSQSRGTVMLTEPGWIIGPNQSVIPIVRTHGSGGGVGGEGAVLIVAQREGSRIFLNQSGPFEVGGGAPTPVNVTITSPRVDAWKQYFEDQGFCSLGLDQDNNNVTCRFETETLYAPETDIEVSFNR